MTTGGSAASHARSKALSWVVGAGAHGGSARADHRQPDLVLLGRGTGQAVLSHTRAAAHAVRGICTRHRCGHNGRHPAGASPLRV